MKKIIFMTILLFIVPGLLFSSTTNTMTVHCDTEKINLQELPETLTFKFVLPAGTEFTNLFLQSIILYKVNSRLVQPAVGFFEYIPEIEDNKKILEIDLSTSLIRKYLEENDHVPFEFLIKKKDYNWLAGRYDFKILDGSIQYINRNIFNKDNSQLNIRFKKGSGEKAQITLFDASGKKIRDISDSRLEEDYVVFTEDLIKLDLTQPFYLLYIRLDDKYKVYKIFTDF